MEDFFLTCPRGLEDITAKQISKYIKDNPVIDKGGISFRGDISDMYLVNLNSRTGMHLLKKITLFKARNSKELYNKIYEYDWGKFMSSNTTFFIKTKSK